TPQPDRFTYQISVEQDGKRHSVTVGETAMPPGIKPLVDFLMKSAH
ncbi:MAG: protealysin inhibitor emfourin, partial [Methylobacter sp.]